MKMTKPLLLPKKLPPQSKAIMLQQAASAVGEINDTSSYATWLLLMV
jgi:hypothetical protein